MQTLPTDYSHQQLVDALVAEFKWYCHDSYDEEFDNNPDKFREYLQPMTHSQLIEETCTTSGDDEGYTLQDFMSNWN